MASLRFILWFRVKRDSVPFLQSGLATARSTSLTAGSRDRSAGREEKEPNRGTHLVSF